MGARGPAKGHGGRPRTKTPAVRGDGYVRTTVGPAGRGTQQLEHRVIAHGGTTAGRKKAPPSSTGAKTVVDHRNRRRSSNRRSNLRIVSRAENNRR